MVNLLWVHQNAWPDIINFGMILQEEMGEQTSMHGQLAWTQWVDFHPLQLGLNLHAKDHPRFRKVLWLLRRWSYNYDICIDISRIDILLPLLLALRLYRMQRFLWHLKCVIARLHPRTLLQLRRTCAYQCEFQTWYRDRLSSEVAFSLSMLLAESFVDWGMKRHVSARSISWREVKMARIKESDLSTM